MGVLRNNHKVKQGIDNQNGLEGVREDNREGKPGILKQQGDKSAPKM